MPDGSLLSGVPTGYAVLLDAAVVVVVGAAVVVVVGAAVVVVVVGGRVVVVVGSVVVVADGRFGPSVVVVRGGRAVVVVVEKIGIVVGGERNGSVVVVESEDFGDWWNLKFGDNFVSARPPSFEDRFVDECFVVTDDVNEVRRFVETALLPLVDGVS